jgi:hypothetical protein
VKTPKKDRLFCGSEDGLVSFVFWTGKTVLHRPVRYGDGVREMEDECIGWTARFLYYLVLYRDNQD